MADTIRIEDIVIDTGLQPRVGGLDADHVSSLQENPEGWPPLAVVLQDGKHILVDGFHRLAAAQNLGLDTVSVQVLDLPADGDLHSLAFALNTAHGRPLSLTDRRTFADRLLRQHPEWADREIGRRCGLSSNTVGAVRERLEADAQIEQPETRVGGGGYVYEVGRNQKQRSLGQLPDTGLGEAIGNAVGRLFTKPERLEQRRIAGYLQRLSVAFRDQDKLEAWKEAEDAATACLAVLGKERASQLADSLGLYSRNVLDVAIALGYQDEQG